ncbi:MAG: hypothetical protein WC822_01490 [Candidatus Paceibacterota bacterium]|jgi:hypothetical protein
MVKDFTSKDLVSMLRESVAPCTTAVMVEKEELFDQFKSMAQMTVKFMWIDGKLNDPVKLFWQAVKNKVMSDRCMVVFTDTRGDFGYNDLSALYGGTRWGNLFFVTYRSNVKPGIMPSQKGVMEI